MYAIFDEPSRLRQARYMNTRHALALSISQSQPTLVKQSTVLLPLIARLPRAQHRRDVYSDLPTPLTYKPHNLPRNLLPRRNKR